MEMSKFDFNLTIPFEKAEREDGWYITALAAGPEVDLQHERLAPSALEGIVRQIEQEPVPFLNWHNKNDALAEMGEVQKAWLTPDFHMGVEIKLDQDDYRAQKLWKKLDQGKQFGLSVSGSGDYKNEIEKSQRVRTYYQVQLDEISLTTKPIYTPSFGTVLRKAADESPEEGDTTSMSEETPIAEETIVEATSTSTQTTEVEKPETPAAPEAQSSEPETESASSGEAVVEKAVSPKTVTAQRLKKLLQANREMNDLLAEFIAGGSTAVDESTDSDTSEEVTEISKSAQTETQSGELEKALNEITRLRDEFIEFKASVPVTPVPPVLTKAEETNILDEVSKASPRERLRFGLAGLHNPER